MLGSSAELPFRDGEFSAVTAITAPANLAEVFRVLRPGGRFVFVDELNPDPKKPSSERTAGTLLAWTEADRRRMIEEAGFTDMSRPLPEHLAPRGQPDRQLSQARRDVMEHDRRRQSRA